jgi:hypothetical protein
MPKRGNIYIQRYYRWLRRISKRPTCPRCGRKGSGLYIKKIKSHGKIYYYRYFAHWDNGRQKWCYVGKE